MSVSPSTKPPKVIEVFADIWCPFTHVGLKAVTAELRVKDRRDVRIWVRSWPLEWVNGRAMDAGAVLNHARDLREQVSPQLFGGRSVATFPRTTIPVLAVAARAYKVGIEVGESFSLEVRDWLFEKGRDVADPGSLAEIRALFELGAPDPDDYATVVAEWKEGRDRGVMGSPHFFCGGSSAFCPSLDISPPGAGGAMGARMNVGRLNAFLDECLAGT